MKILFLIFVLLSLCVVIYVSHQKVYGDGFTQETLPAATVGNRAVSLFIKINPPIITSDNNQDRYLLFRWFDANTNKTIPHTTFLVFVTKHDQLLVQSLFHTHTGVLKLKITPSYDKTKWSINGTREPFLEGTMYLPQGDNPIDITAPMLGEGGLYHIYVLLVTIDSDSNLFTPQTSPKFDSFLSVGDVSNHDVHYHNNSYNTTLVSYYDKTGNFDFDQSKMQVSWSMLFDWNSTRFQNMPIFVHEELRVPKSFKEFGATPTFTGTVNGNPISGAKIIADPYSFSDILVLHVLLNKNEINDIAKVTPLKVNTMNFTVIPSTPNIATSATIYTDFGGWEINLGWNPGTILANSQNNIKVSFSDIFTARPVLGDVNYDLKILDNNTSVILSKTDLVARNGAGAIPVNLPGNGIYSIQIVVKSIVSNNLPDSSRSGLARGNLVIPSDISQSSVPELGSLVGITAILSMIFCVAISRRFLDGK